MAFTYARPDFLTWKSGFFLPARALRLDIPENVAFWLGFSLRQSRLPPSPVRPGPPAPLPWGPYPRGPGARGGRGSRAVVTTRAAARRGFAPLTHPSLAKAKFSTVS